MDGTYTNGDAIDLEQIAAVEVERGTTANGTGGPRRLPSRTELREQRKRQEDPAFGLMFPLTQPAAFAGVLVRVRMMSLADAAFLNTLPTSVQSFVMESIGDMAGQTARAVARKDDPLWKRARRNISLRADVARAVVPYLWISPRVVARIEDLPEIEDPDNPVWHIDDIHSDDLVRFYSLIAGEDQDGLKSLEPFLGAGESGDVVPVGPALETSSADL